MEAEVVDDLLDEEDLELLELEDFDDELELGTFLKCAFAVRVLDFPSSDTVQWPIVTSLYS